MKRFNSDPSRSCMQANASTILGGNLSEYLRDVEALSEEDELEKEFHEDDTISEGVSAVDAVLEPVTSEDIIKADTLLYSIFGINLISSFTKLVLTGKLLPTDFVCQSLAYKLSIPHKRK